MRRLWWCAVAVLWLVAGCSGGGSGVDPFEVYGHYVAPEPEGSPWAGVAAAGGVPDGWVEVFEGSFRSEEGSWVFVDQWASMVGLGGRLRHRVVPWPDPWLEWMAGDRRFDDDVLVVLEFVDESGAVVATGDDWATLSRSGAYFFEVVMGDVPAYWSYRLRVGSEVLVEFAPAASAPDVEVVEVTSSQSPPEPPAGDVEPDQPGERVRTRQPEHAPTAAEMDLVGEMELVVATPEPRRLAEDFHVLVYFSKDGSTYTRHRAHVLSVVAEGPGRVVVTVPRTAAPDGPDYYVETLTHGAARARLLVVFTDGGRWAAAESPRVSLGRALAPLILQPIVQGVSDASQWRFAPGERIRLVSGLSSYLSFQPDDCALERAVSWSSDIDGSLDSLIDTPEGWCAPYVLDTAELTPGEHLLTASVTDYGLTATVSLDWLITIDGDPAAAGERIAIIARDDHPGTLWETGSGDRICWNVLANDRAHTDRIDTAAVSIIEPPAFGTAAITDGSTCPRGHPSKCPERRWCLEYTVVDADGLRSYGDRVTYQICNTQPQPQCDTAELHIPRPQNLTHY